MAKTTSSKTAPDATAEPAQLHGTKVGVVESDKCTKTRKVVVQFKERHPKYGKFVAKRTVLQVHDENNESSLGDTVEVTQCRPISKTKRWRLVRIVAKSRRVELIKD
jgi:small subunit ribosomal protein S17